MSEIAGELARIRSENARLLQRLSEGEQRLRLISKGVLRVQEAERGRIARELHDGVGQSLTALKMQIELMEQSASTEDSALARRLAELKEIADRSLQDVRQISQLLRPQMLDDLGLVPTLRWLARSIRQRTGVEVDLRVDGIDDRLEADLETLVYRVAQEALTNVAKHARAKAARVEVRRDPGKLSMIVKDNGVGFDVAQVFGGQEHERGFGLHGMRDRVQLFGGCIEVRSSPANGTVIEIEIPLPEEEEES